MMSPAKRDAETTAQLRTSFVEHARRLITRSGASALTMRALAAEAGSAVGLPYKVFKDRRDLISAIVQAEVGRFHTACGELLSRAGTGTVGGNLSSFAGVLLDSPAVALVGELMADQALVHSIAAGHGSELGPMAFPAIVSNYLDAEKEAGRIRPEIDVAAFGFLIAGALHNLVVSGEAWPRPDRPELERFLDATAAAIAVRR
jgi:AcrR family transcriptional regulator